MTQLQMELIPTATVVPKERRAFTVSAEQQGSLETALSRIFPTSETEDQIMLVRRVLGERVKQLTDQELIEALTPITQLIEAWLDDFERGIFDGKTLRDLF